MQASRLQSERQRLESQSGAGGARALAEFLDRHDPAHSRSAYAKWADAETDPANKKMALRQLVLNDFEQGQTDLVKKDLDAYRAVGGTDLQTPAAQDSAPANSSNMISIPGPLPAFARMAALSPDVSPDDLLPSLARNVVTNGYEAAGNEALQQTEYLRLVFRYLGQARELQSMAGADRKIVVPNCDSEQTGALLKTLGYRMRGSCGGDIVLETVNPTRAFLTVDSGFPLAHLEAELRANHKFELPYAPTTVPVLYTPAYWIQALNKPLQGEFIDAFLSDPSLCRLYLGLSHVERGTAEALRKQSSPVRLKTFAHVLDFYGSMFEIRNGAAVVPGSPRAWQSLIGVSPNNPGAFFDKMLSMDDGWSASFYDALCRTDAPIAAYLTQPDRLKRFYDALRGRVTSPGPARPVFRSSTELMLLTASLRLDGNGTPHIPGGLDVWRTLFVKHPHGKYDAKLTRAAGSWRGPDDLLEALFALSRKTVENEPLRIYLALNDVDRNRAKPISPELASRLISSYRQYGPQYNLFADAPGLSEASINRYLDTCNEINGLKDSLLRADAGGTLQASTELWRLMALHGQISPNGQDFSFSQVIAPFARVRQETELFDATRTALDKLLTAANAPANPSRQERLTEALVGKLRTAEGENGYSRSESFRRVVDAQRLISLDTMFAMGAAKGQLDQKLLKSFSEQMDRIAEIDNTRSTLSSEERNAFVSGYWSSRHLEQERKFNLEKLTKAGSNKDVREALMPFVRDTMVGLLYAYYAPPGAQLLLTNPSFVRNHDFIGPENSPSLWHTTEVSGSGWPASSGGKLTGSLSGLAYALAESEQNFLTPHREQALIWADLVPQMIADVTIPRWSDVKPEQLQWVNLHLQRGRNLLAAAALDAPVRKALLESMHRYTTPARVDSLAEQLRRGQMKAVLSEVPPSILYALAEDTSLQQISPDVTSTEIASLRATESPAVRSDEIGRLFGSPKPTLTHSYQPGLLYLRTFPALMGYSSRILAETWESNALYYGALADELGLPTSDLDSYVLDWNRATIENIFATHLEDWPAILRSLETTGSSIREKSNAAALTAQN